MKVKITITIILIAIAATIIGLYKAGLLGNRTRVSVVEDTPNIVEAVEQIQELCTEYYYDEVMVRDSVVKTGAKAAVSNTVNSVVESTGNFFSNMFSSKKEEEKKPEEKKVMSQLEKELVVIVKVTCRVGWDLKEIVANNGMQVNGDTLFIDLPKAKFLETIANPTDINIFVEDGNWKFPEELQGAINHAKGIVEQRAIADSIIEKADESGRKILSNLFSTMGFKVFFSSKNHEAETEAETESTEEATTEESTEAIQ